MTSNRPVRVERASGNDLVELVCDTTGTSMQVAAVLMLDTRSPVDIAAVREVIAERIKAVPRLRQRLVDAPFGCGGPVWVDDPAFDIGDHVTSAVCPAPGDERALLRIVAEAVTTRLVRDKPLWSATLVTDVSPDRSALAVVFHHVLADGIGGLAVLAHLVDGVPVALDRGFPRRAPRRRELAADAVRSRARAVGRLPIGMNRLRAAVAEAGIGRRAHAPRCSLNRPTGTNRVLAVARVDLAAVQVAARAQGGTINDAVLSAVAGALRTVLAARGEDVDHLVVSIPVSTRRQAGITELGNRVGVIPVEIPTTGDPIRRLAAVARITRQRKTAAPGSSTALLGWMFRALAKIGVYRWFVDRQRLVTTFVSDLHGPDHAMSFLGAPVVDLIPVSGISGNVTVAFAALSYAGTLTVTVIADPDRVPDLDDLADALRRELHAQG
ncbi:wax ester/triacylglycerol synthase domain-containing protein [Umezawaea sp. Da 62-37]|uniref:wax ester/triacylglycerol synthase domain-containing protein n=1 Tax=Umezawaea sp. Da 62-37 TaxID=3075927 RepID=UPI0028F71A84|nr:wax ester/triacylglycerol synthase domain-containing protein [Umezawaea sp. Da 62-37]WNV84783.1 wax ester/triacylglycerol synthase family O-acyltransferase [Umezawaea sp. Da 62-37]